MSEYECVKQPLKLKGEKKKNKKKRKHEEDSEEGESEKKKLVQVEGKAPTNKEVKHEIAPTKAELKFQKQQEKVQKKRILKLASMTHKQRVEEFNRHLDSLTEHFDIPKVSWTK